MFHIIFLCDPTRKSIDIFILRFLQKFCIPSVIFNRQTPVTSLSWRPDGIIQQIIFDKASELLLTNPHKESKHIPRILLTKETEISFFTLGIAPVRDPASYQVAIVIGHLKAFEILLHDLFKDFHADGQNLLPRPLTDLSGMKPEIAGKVFCLDIVLEDAFDQ